MGGKDFDSGMIIPCKGIKEDDRIKWKKGWNFTFYEQVIIYENGNGLNSCPNEEGSLRSIDRVTSPFNTWLLSICTSWTYPVGRPWVDFATPVFSIIFIVVLYRTSY
jgi:hypothetical protein